MPVSPQGPLDEVIALGERRQFTRPGADAAFARLIAAHPGARISNAAQIRVTDGAFTFAEQAIPTLLGAIPNAPDIARREGKPPLRSSIRRARRPRCAIGRAFPRR